LALKLLKANATTSKTSSKINKVLTTHIQPPAINAKLLNYEK